MAINLAMTGVLIALLLAFDRAALGLFLGSGSEAVEVARHIQYLATWTFLPFGTTIVVIGTLRANGAVVPPLIILFLSMFPIRLGFYRSEEHTSELQSLMRSSYAVFCLKKKTA